MKRLILLLALMAVQNLKAQIPAANVYAHTDRKILSIPDSMTGSTSGIADFINANFNTEDDKARAAFIWVASCVGYDLDNMFAINYRESLEDKIAKTLATRKGICENYAALFNDICSKIGIRSYMIDGYTKHKDHVNHLAHTWCAAQIEGEWYIFDPTWGSGYVSNGKFHKKTNNYYYKASPSQIIASHMPFDYLWQFLEYPVTGREFLSGRTGRDNTGLYFNYADSIKLYDEQARKERLAAEIYRVEKNGVVNSLTFNRLNYLRTELDCLEANAENERLRKIYEQYNNAVAEYNCGVNAMNDYIAFRNNQFMPTLPDQDIQSKIDLAVNRFRSSKEMLTIIQGPDEPLKIQMEQLLKSIDGAIDTSVEHQEWVKTYLSKGKMGRRTMLISKITWFGIPVYGK